MKLARLLAGAALAAALGPARAHAQRGPNDPGVAAELRADAILGHRPALQVGGGVQLPLGYYARLGVDGLVGIRTDQVSPRADARLDLLGRFLLDPFRQSPYGLSVGGGMSLRAEPRDRVRPYLLLAAEVEGRRRASGWVPALQLGLGGGARLGVVLRRAPAVRAR